jgi:hypothetical protein
MKLRLGIILLILTAFYSVAGFAQSREEFNGPYVSWADVKKLGAKGNGKDDDTKAIQSAIEGLYNPVTKANAHKGAYTVLYLPAGTYCISSTLLLRGKIGVNIVGEDPDKTIIKWIGGNGATMFWANGSAYYQIGRIGWDANGHKDIEAIGIHWRNVWNDANSKSFASLNIEISDCYFKGGCKYGISGGTYTGADGTGSNDSEITIKRCIFEACSEAGVEIHGFNALDYWIWDCQFLKCYIGVKNSHGNYHVYRSYFTGTTFADLRNNNGYYLSVRGCFSENANAFSSDEGVSCNPFKRVFQNNTVLNLQKWAIDFYHTGKVTLWQNTFSKVQHNPNVQYIVGLGTWCPGIFEVMSIKNNYELKEPFLNPKLTLVKQAVGDNYAAKISGSAQTFLKGLDQKPLKKVRKVFEVPAGADSRAIQSIIDQAATLKGQRPVVHFGVGAYSIDKTIVIPEGSDMQLVGDGLLYATVLNGAKISDFKKNPLILVKGPSYITIKDLQIGEEGDRNPSSAIVFENVDQAAAEAHIDQIYSHADTFLVSDKLDYLYIEKNNSFFTDGTYVNGGSLVTQKKGTARVCCYGGQFVKLSVNNGGRFIGKDCWWEGDTRVPLDLKGSGDISLDGAMIAPRPADSVPVIKIGEFNGNINLLNMYVVGAISVDPGNSTLNFLLWNINFYHKINALEYVKPGTKARLALLGVNAQCFDKREACNAVFSIPDKVSRVTDLPAFLDNMTSFDRSQKPLVFRNLPAGISNIYISRVSVGASRRGIVFIK